METIVLRTEKRKGEIVEIGSFCGKSTICLAQSLGRVYAVDPHKGNVGDGLTFASTFASFKKNIKFAKVADKILPVVSTSEDAAKKWNKKIRALFIDGLHDYEHAEQDFDLWSKYVVDGGIVAVHDSFLRWCGSEKMALQKIVLSKDFYKIGVVGSITYGIKGKGNLFSKIEKKLVQTYILFAVHLNHLRIVLMNLPELRYKFAAKYGTSQ
ncbi:MAG: class I SAM-dependent methyltransferase [Candidatus Levyibacteriota bacterium]